MPALRHKNLTSVSQQIRSSSTQVLSVGIWADRGNKGQSAEKEKLFLWLPY